MALADGAGAGAGVLRKIGAGTLQLTATANTYSGTTQVQGGVLDITDDRQLGAAPGADAAQQLLLDGGTLRIGADTVLTATRHPPPAACGLWPVATPISRAEACVWHPPGSAALPAPVQPSTDGSGSALGICCARPAQGRRQFDSLR